MKIITKLIAILSIITSTITLIRVYPDLNDISYNSKGWVEYIILITSVLLNFNGLNLTIVLKKTSKYIMQFALILYLLSVLIPIYSLNHILLIPTIFVSFITLIISHHFIYKSNTKQSFVVSIILFILSIGWNLYVIGV